MPKIKFRIKEHVGSHYIGNKKYGPGDVIELALHNAESIADKLERLDPLPVEPEPVTGLIIVETENDLFDVINESSQARLNIEPLSLADAKELAGDDAEIKLMRSDPGIIKAVHRGGGRYILVYDETEERIVDHYFTRMEAQKTIEEIANGTLSASDLGEAISAGVHKH